MSSIPTPEPPEANSPTTQANANKEAGTRPLTITIKTEGVSRQYSELMAQPSKPQLAVSQTIAALRADILRGAIPKETKAIFEMNTVGDPKPRVREGTLVECASRYPALSEIYTPVRRYARSGMEYGILCGVVLNLVLLGFLVIQRNEAGLAGLGILALPICYITMWLSISKGVAIPSALQNICGLAGALIIPGYLGLNGLFPMLLGAAFSGGLLFSMPGMTVGAIIGAIRRQQIPRAYDAVPEGVVLRIMVPFAVGSALWVAYYFLVRAYLPQLLNAA